jgi:phosphatidylglycerol:prolipoprotein diacylglycerol transferase
MIPAFIKWNVDPVLLRIGNYEMQWYSVLLLLGFYISYLFLDRMFDKEGVSKSILHSSGVFIVLGLFIGGRLAHCLFYEPEYYLKYPWHMIIPWRGQLGKGAVFVGYRGMSGHGSAVGILLGLIINAIRTKTSIIWIIDRIAIFAPLVGFFVRLGNLINSEILGKVTKVPWGFIFMRADRVPRHPVQLYESLAYLGVFIISYSYYKKRAGREKPGAILGLVFLLFFSIRFLLEFFKAKQSDVETGMLMNMGQVLSIPFIIVGLILFFRPAPRR